MNVLPESTEPCVLYPAGDPAPRLIRIGLTEPVPANRAPVPANEAERMVFRHLFQTLLTLDCEGEVEPGLAQDWSSENEGHEWRFELVENARWSDGTRLTAEDVREGWLRNRDLAPREAPWIWVDPDSIRTLGERVLHVPLLHPLKDASGLFAHPALAVAKRESSKGWPLGTGPYLISLDRDQTVSMIANPYAGEAYRPPLEFLVQPGADPRDLLAQGVDVLLTGNKDALAYASELPRYKVSVEKIGTAYLLLSRYLDPQADARIHGTSEDLARNVVISEALAIRAYLVGLCEMDFDPLEIGYPAPEDPERNRVVYRQEDVDARALAERLVAVALSSPDGTHSKEGVDSSHLKAAPIAAPLSADEFAPALKTGRDWGYVYSARSDPYGLCLAKGKLLLDAPWLAESEKAIFTSSEPLVLVHTRLVSRTALRSIRRDGDGVFLFDRAGWVEDEVAP